MAPDAVAMPRDHRDRRRIELAVDGELAFVEYALEGTTIDFAHTFVPERLRGRGLATRLVEAALAMARREGLQVIPSCPVFSAWMKAHPATHDQLAPEGRALV